MKMREGCMFSDRNWPALIIGVVIVVYWGRVMFMVRRAPQVAGHGANLVPPERLGRTLRVIWLPIIVLWALLPFAAFFVKSARRYPNRLEPILVVHRFPTFLGWL